MKGVLLPHHVLGATMDHVTETLLKLYPLLKRQIYLFSQEVGNTLSPDGYVLPIFAVQKDTRILKSTWEDPKSIGIAVS